MIAEAQARGASLAPTVLVSIARDLGLPLHIETTPLRLAELRAAIAAAGARA